MLRMFAKPLPLVLLLGFGTFIPVVMALVRVVQIPLGALPEDSLRLAVAPLSHFLHAVGGATFGILGPLQFVGVLRRRFGRLHRILGRVFVVAGMGLGLSGLSLLWHVPSIATPLLDDFRGFAGIALVVALSLGLSAAIRRDIASHRAWIIRAYAIGMGSGTVALVMLPIYLITGAPVTGVWSDVVFVGWWSLNIALAELAIRQGHRSRSRPAVVGA